MGHNVIYVRQKGSYKRTKMTYANLNNFMWAKGTFEGLMGV